MSNKSLAKIVGDINDLETFIANDEFLRVVNQPPPDVWVKEHPLAEGVKYMPIEIIETLLTRIFQQWYVEVIREGQLLNAIFVTVRLYFKHPITNEWQHHDGTGAVAIQTDKGEVASNMAAIKSDAIMKGLPAAKSFAIKDAAEHIGKLFGRDLNRKDTMAFSGSYATKQARTLATKKKNAIKEKLKASL